LLPFPTLLTATLRDNTNLYSMTSNSDTNHPDSRVDSSTAESTNFSSSQPRPRYDSNALLMLPAPLAVNRSAASAASSSSTALARHSDDAYMSEAGSASNQRLIPIPTSPEQYNDSPFEYPAPQARYPSGSVGIPSERQVSRSAGSTPILRTSAVPNQYPGETQNPFRTSFQPQVTAYEEPGASYTPEPEELSPASSRAARGVRLADNGPVPGPDGVRRISRAGGKRNSSQQPPQNRYSRGSTYNLPPGAAPPQAGYTSGGN